MGVWGIIRVCQCQLSNGCCTLLLLLDPLTQLPTDPLANCSIPAEFHNRSVGQVKVTTYSSQLTSDIELPAPSVYFDTRMPYRLFSFSISTSGLWRRKERAYEIQERC